MLPSRADMPSNAVMRPLALRGRHDNPNLVAFANLSLVVPQYFRALSLLASAPGLKVRPAERNEFE